MDRARSEKTVDAAEVIYKLTAFALIPDRSTLQIGIGDVSAAMCLYLDDRHDLGAADGEPTRLGVRRTE
jgi:4-hydroxybutyrate CoA-transferase